MLPEPNGPNAIVIESVGLNDLEARRSESGITKQLFDLIGWQCSDFSVATQQHLSVAARKVAATFSHCVSAKVLVVSAHGSSHGIELTDRSFVKWEDFFSAFGESLKGSTVIFSSCNVLKHGHMQSFLDRFSAPPSQVIGFSDEITWANAATAMSLLINVICRLECSPNRSGEFYHLYLFNSMAALSQLLNVDVGILSFSPPGKSGSASGRNISYANIVDPDQNFYTSAASFAYPEYEETLLRLKQLGYSINEVQDALSKLLGHIHKERDGRINEVQLFREAFSRLESELSNSKAKN